VALPTKKASRPTLFPTTLGEKSATAGTSGAVAAPGSVVTLAKSAGVDEKSVTRGAGSVAHGAPGGGVSSE